MLNLHKTYPGCPSAGLHHLVLPQETLLVRYSPFFPCLQRPDCRQIYPFADAVVILNARSLSLVRVLAFWEVFRQTLHTADKVSCISVDPGMKLVRSLPSSSVYTYAIYLFLDSRVNELSHCVLVALGCAARRLAGPLFACPSARARRNDIA